MKKVVCIKENKHLIVGKNYTDSSTVASFPTDYSVLVVKTVLENLETLDEDQRNLDVVPFDISYFNFYIGDNQVTVGEYLLNS